MEIFIPASHSLKEKRQVIRRIKDKLKNGYNVSFSEIDYHDKWQRAEFGFVTIAKNRITVDKRLDRIQRMIEQDDRIQVINIQREYL